MKTLDEFYRTMKYRGLLHFSLVVALTACSGGVASLPGTSGVPLAMPAVQEDAPSAHRIKHVIILVQTNRSFDNLFGHFPGADGAKSGLMSDGTVIKLKKTKLYDPKLYQNSHQAFLVEYDGGKMDRWNLVYVNLAPCSTCAYAFVDPKQIKPYWTLAKQYVLADHMFSTESSGDFTAHQDLIRGNSAINTTESLIDFPSRGPWGCDAPAGTTTPLLTNTGQYIPNGPPPCMTYNTLRDLLDAKHVSWKYYTPNIFTSLAGAYWGAFDAISAVRYGPEWKTNVSTPETNIFKDIKKGQLSDVSWVMPSDVHSDHAGFGSFDAGPAWVAKVVNAVGTSKYWDSSAIIVVWDDWGGWYDHVPPPQLDYAGLGFRVPMIVVSPYAKQGFISHTQYEFGSIIRLIEDNWNLGSLGTTDTRAAKIKDAFNFAQKPRAFVPVPK
jgi:phospholipase C